MKSLIACIAALLLLLGIAPALAQTKLSGSFIAAKACPALQSIKNGTNPGNVTLGVGSSYRLLGGNKSPASYYWIVVPDATPDYRWVATDCGRLDAAATTASQGSTAAPVSAAATTAYVLALSWEPAFCEGLPEKAECKAETPQSFEASHLSLHGLWPQPRSKAYCGVAPAVAATDKAHDWAALPGVTLSPTTKTDLDTVMPGTKSYLERHEWIVHGTCSGVGEDVYFHRASLFAGTIDNTAVNSLLAGRVGKHVDAAEIRAAFDTAFGKGAGDRVRVACERDGDRSLISEITVGLSGDVTGTGGLAELILAAAPTTPGCPGGLIDPAGLQ